MVIMKMKTIIIIRNISNKKSNKLTDEQDMFCFNHAF